MYHIIHVGMSSEALKQLDELRENFPNTFARRDIILKLVAEAHARFATSKATQPTLHIAA